MLLYIFRHGESERPKNAKAEAKDAWHLTRDGERWVANVVSLAEKELGFHPDRILSSPLARATETAEIAHRTLAMKSDVAVEESLLGDAQVADVYRALRQWKQDESVALVTHQPLIDRLLADLLGGESNVGLYNGAIACIRTKTNPGHGKGTLLWLLPPRQWYDGKQWL